ncbi:MAG TPA: dienelactone hydrolase family protein [Dehalococcoidia bacterium]|nr:dienelactone hydrolase family protein [Dehalococcoidia bacterium]
MATHKPDDSKYDYLREYMLDEVVEEYRENRIGRRELLRRVLIMTGSIPFTASIVSACTTPSQTAATPTSKAATGAASPAAGSPAAAPKTSPAPPAVKTAPSPSPAARTSPSPSPSPQSAVTIPPTDPAIEVRDVQFPSQGATITGYLSQPRGVTQAPAIIVIHQNEGLNEHIKDITRRYAKDGIVALGIDLLSRQGGTERFQDPRQLSSALFGANQGELVQDLVAGVAYLKSLPTVAGPKVGAVGYCYGGGMTWLVAINSPDIGAANPYYGDPPQPIDDVQRITAPVLAFYGENDQRVNQHISAIEEAMARYNKPFEKVVYPGAGHAFNSDHQPQRYNANAARDAYQKSVAFFKENVGA